MDSIINYTLKQKNFVLLNTEVRKIAKQFYSNSITQIFVKNEFDEIVGLINRKVIFKYISEGFELQKLKAEDIMIKDFFKIDKNISLEDCYDIFAKTRYNTIPVFDIDENKLIGSVNRKMINKEKNKFKKLKIYNLEDRLKTIK
ncbi:MAG: CBS domain-containing protein [Candidatus Lokiarchaeota archaeon]|nr:CBS domain-containing protein [Candidatus Lokiarchaeota archaeon]